jgi:hypothetical protein
MPNQKRNKPRPPAPDPWRIGNRSDAILVLDTVIRKTRTAADRLRSVAGGLTALRDALEREII